MTACACRKAERSQARHNDPQAFEDAINEWRAAGGNGAHRGSLSKASTAWTATARRSTISRRSLSATMRADHRRSACDRRFRPGRTRTCRASRRQRQRHHAAHVRQGARRHGCVWCWLRARSATFSSTAPAPSFTQRRLRRSSPQPSAPRSNCVEASRSAASNCIACCVRWQRTQDRKRAFTPSGSQIQPVIVGADAQAVALASSLKARGFDIRAIRPPTVPEGTARLRLTLTLNTDETIVSRLISALAAAQAEIAA